MKRRSFLRNSGFAAGAAMIIPAQGATLLSNSEKSILELRVYAIARGGNNKGILLNYYRDALMPVFKNKGVEFLFFDEYSREEPVKLYVLIAYSSLSLYAEVQASIWNDAAYLKAAQNYNELLPASSPFSRYETYLMEAFDRWPSLVLPAADKKGFELRIYESSNEEFGRRKVLMFNKEEIDVFIKKGLEPVFFGRILAGRYMPALMYMIGLPDVESRDKTWEAFNTSSEWAEMRVKPEYANTVSNIRRMFLLPVSV